MSKNIITTDTPTDSAPKPAGHTLSIFVANQPGVLMRISQVFARRGYNIDSLVVSEGRDPKYSRMTIGLSGDPEGLEQIVKQVTKLIDVIHCFEHTSANSVVKELVLVKAIISADQRTEALQILEHFGGKTVDLTNNSLIAMLTGNTEKVDSALAMFSNFEIIETVRTGKVVMARGEQGT